MKKFSEKDKLLILKNKLINEIMFNDFINFYNSNTFNNHGRFVRYLGLIQNLNNWDTNYIKFNEYAISNYKQFAGTYDPIYVSLQRNIDIDSANVIIKNMRPINTLEGFISRFGEELGKEKFELFKKRSITRSKELCSEYEIRSSSVWCKEFYMKRGYSEEESILLAKEFNKNNSGANRYFWENKGYSEDQINEIMKPINISKAYGKIQYKEKYGDDWINKWDQRIKKYRKTINALEFNDELELYYNECQKYTDHSITLYSDYLENFELRGRKYDYQLDHVYSIKQGFLDNISPKIIGHITNLRVIKSFDNSSKGSKCDKTLTELFEDVLKFNEINGNKK